MYISREMKNWISFFVFFHSRTSELTLIKGQGWLETVAMHGCLEIVGRIDIKPACQTVDRPAVRERSTEENRVASRWLVVPSGCHSDGGMYVDCPLRYPSLACVRVYMSACVCE